MGAGQSRTRYQPNRIFVAKRDLMIDPNYEDQLSNTAYLGIAAVVGILVVYYWYLNRR